MIIGHKKNLDFLEKALKDNNLANVYCFFGPEEVGKKTVAFFIASKILSTEPENLLKHPDFLFLEREFEEKTGKTKKDISVEQVNKSTLFLKNKPWIGKRKVLILDGAHFLNSSSANAFLKTLEEPGENNFIFLVALDEKKIPNTILSRSQKLLFSLVSDVDIKKYLQETNRENVDEILYWSWGRPGRMFNLLNKDNLISDLRFEKERWLRIGELSFYERLREVEDIFGSPKGDHIKSREYLLNILDIWTILWREKFLKDADYDQNFLKIFDLIKEAKELLQKNIHPRLLIEKLLLNF